jgi:hypothetical protein
LKNKYKVTKLFETQFQTETETYNLEVSVDSLGQANLMFGSSFSLRLDYKGLDQLATILKECQGYIENEAIDLAGQTKLPLDMSGNEEPTNIRGADPSSTYHNDVVDW